jgi:hypothetical protein
LLRIAIASVAMAAVAAGVDAWLASALPGADLMRQVVRLGLSIAAALLVLAAAAWALRIREFHAATNMVMRRLRRPR